MINNNRKGQNAIEYLLLFAIIIIVILFAISPNGFFTRAVDDSLDLSVNNIERMASNVWAFPN